MMSMPTNRTPAVEISTSHRQQQSKLHPQPRPPSRRPRSHPRPPPPPPSQSTTSSGIWTAFPWATQSPEVLRALGRGCPSRHLRNLSRRSGRDGLNGRRWWIGRCAAQLRKDMAGSTTSDTVDWAFVWRRERRYLVTLSNCHSDCARSKVQIHNMHAQFAHRSNPKTRYTTITYIRRLCTSMPPPTGRPSRKKTPIKPPPVQPSKTQYTQPNRQKKHACALVKNAGWRIHPHPKLP